MPGRTSATLWLTESAQLPAPRRASKTSGPTSFPDMLAEKSDTRPDTGDQRLLPDSGLAAAPSTSTPSTRAAAQRLPVGILLYLISVGLVAAATIAVFFGTGFFLLAHHVEEATAGSDSSDHGIEIKSPRSGVFQHFHNDDLRALVETEFPRSVTATALPIVPFAQGPTAYQAPPLENSEAARSSVPGSPVGEAPMSAAGVASSTEKVPVLGWQRPRRHSPRRRRLYRRYGQRGARRHSSRRRRPQRRSGRGCARGHSPGRCKPCAPPQGDLRKGVAARSRRNPAGCGESERRKGACRLACRSNVVPATEAAR